MGHSTQTTTSACTRSHRGAPQCPAARRRAHKVNAQLERDGIAVPPQAVVDESVLAKNCMPPLHG
eukprot:8391431-Pyramimonas_sp.AAC.1